MDWTYVTVTDAAIRQIREIILRDLCSGIVRNQHTSAGSVRNCSIGNHVLRNEIVLVCLSCVVGMVCISLDTYCSCRYRSACVLYYVKT
jgi:hypothetical protein